MAVDFDVIQSGGTSATIHASSGDTLTFLLPDTTGGHNDALENAIAGLNALSNVTGVTFAASLAGGASGVLRITQSGSGSTVLNFAAADTCTIELASTIENDQLAAANAYLQALTPITGVIFAVNTSGGAS